MGAYARRLYQGEYAGCTVNFKTYTDSIWDKKQRETPVKKQASFEDTHEAIIEKDIFEKVQVIRESVLERMVLEHIQLVIGYILRYRQHFISVMYQPLQLESVEKLQTSHKQLERNERRISELKRLFV